MKKPTKSILHLLWRVSTHENSRTLWDVPDMYGNLGVHVETRLAAERHGWIISDARTGYLSLTDAGRALVPSQEPKQP